MKLFANKSFQHPVLRPNNNDFRRSNFSFKINPQIINSEVTIDLVISNDVEELKNLIYDNNLTYVVVITCRNTYYKKTIQTHLSELNFQLSANDLKGEVVFDVFCFVKRQIDNFNSVKLNSEYKGANLTINQNEIIAQADSISITIDRDAFQPIANIFLMVIDQTINDNEWEISLEDKIKIHLSDRTKNQIDQARNNRKKKLILLNSLYFSVINYAIDKLVTEGIENLDQSLWARVLNAKLINMFGSDYIQIPVYVLSSKLLNNPLGKLIDMWSNESGD
jgi:hypothetical protein